MAIEKVTVVGGSGTAGSAVVSALLASPFQLTILARASSTSKLPGGARIIKVADSHPLDELVAAFTGQDAVVSTLGVLATDVQKRIIDAAAQAGIKRFIPSEFGLNLRNARTLARIPAMASKGEIIDHLKAQETKGLSWTGIATGAFFDWGLENGWLRVDLKNRSVQILNDGTAKFSTSILPRVGESVVQVLKHEAETRNRYIYTQSFNVSQQDIVKSLEAVSGQKWAVDFLDEETFIKDNATQGDADDMKRIENVVFAQAVLDCDFEKEGLSNDVLGLQAHSLDAEIEKILNSAA
ncbi:hypothetical protein FH972_024931 [Carpinus fangiana]|uniref:NmrA-like domain-containing protein n=1 Tax=Carpinus fangiana TaxID=176857 RepID=A0A5N6KZW2_9ROSI|nr:hypothetical protein FH972_024931 [Carpinus fangiana]